MVTNAVSMRERGGEGVEDRDGFEQRKVSLSLAIFQASQKRRLYLTMTALL